MADLVFPGLPVVQTMGSNKLPVNVNLQIWQGDAYRFSFKLVNPYGQPISYTGQTVTAFLREGYSPTSELFNFTCTVVSSAVEIYLPSPVSKQIPVGNYIWNLQLTATNGDVRTYVAGDVDVFPEADR